jgi:hypothetical protein
MTAPLPKVIDLPIHADKLPTTTKGIVEELARIMNIDLHHDTKRDEYTMVVLSGIMLFRHLDRYERQTILEMIQNEDHIAAIDWWEMIDRCTDVLVQPYWGLWSLTNEELTIMLNDQELKSKFFMMLGVSVSASSIWEYLKKAFSNVDSGKAPLTGMRVNLAIFVSIVVLAYINEDQLKQTKTEIDRRTPNMKKSKYH